MPNDALPEDWEILKGWLGGDLEESARRCGFIRRNTGRINAEGWLRLMLMHVAGGLSLEQTMLRASELGWAELSHVALFKRLRGAQRWLCELCASLIGEIRARLGADAQWPQGWTVRLIDATDVQEPGSTGTDWRVHYSLRMPQMVCDHFEITDEKGGEKFGRFGFSKDELAVADRGYSHRAGVAHVLSQGAQVLVRWNPAAFPLQDGHGRTDDMLRWLRTLPARAAKERAVWFSHGGKRHPMRLCAVRKSRLATEAAQRKAREKAKDRKREIQPETLEYAGYVMVLCSADKARLPLTAALGLYRGRWQVDWPSSVSRACWTRGMCPRRAMNPPDHGCSPNSSQPCSSSGLSGKESSFPPGAMAFGEHDTPSRWRIFIEVRDCIRSILAPALGLPHLLNNAARISRKARVRRPKRPLQGAALNRFIFDF